MTDDSTIDQQPAQAQPRWQPIGAIDRRVAGVLAEKAKATPDAYPLSLGATCNACNQKSNRSPVMQLAPEDVEESLQRLRELGAAGIVEGYGRVAKYRHYLYEWLAVDKVELAVMTELLLRGAQTEGELRARAARMEPIGDLAALRPVVASLKSKGLVISLTPEGRGHVVTHTLYQPQELEKIKAQYGQVPTAAPAERPAAHPPAPAPAAPAMDAETAEVLRRDIGELRSQLAQLRSDLEELSDRQERTDEELRELKDALGA